MDMMMALRRKVMAAAKQKLVDTTPKIAEYGVSCAYSATGEQSYTTMCITDYYLFNPQQLGKLTIHVYLPNANFRMYNYQYSNEDESFKDWYYDPGDGRLIGNATATLYRIRFSILQAVLDDCYAYCTETGQIFYAGKNSIYYGYTNLNDMPSA